MVTCHSTWHPCTGERTELATHIIQFILMLDMPYPTQILLMCRHSTISSQISPSTIQWATWESMRTNTAHGNSILTLERIASCHLKALSKPLKWTRITFKCVTRDPSQLNRTLVRTTPLLQLPKSPPTETCSATQPNAARHSTLASSTSTARPCRLGPRRATPSLAERTKRSSTRFYLSSIEQPLTTCRTLPSSERPSKRASSTE